LRIRPRAYVFPDPVLFCALDEDEAGQHDAGGRAVASHLLGDHAREEDAAFIALAWESAFRRREEREDTIDVDAPTSEGPAEGERMPAWLRTRGSTKRLRKAKVRRQQRQEKEAPRELVDLDELDLSSIGVTVAPNDRVGMFRYPQTKKLVDPKTGSRRARTPASGTRAGDRNYTATDREDVAFAIVEAYLAETAQLDLEDLREQPNVGADAVDRTKDIWVELKAAGRDRDDTVKLERSEAMRAKEKGDRFWLVLVWNLEKPRTPQLLIVKNPLARLDTFLGSGIKLVGLDELARDS
jgi:Protein NO VEIN, C-terminal